MLFHSVRNIEFLNSCGSVLLHKPPFHLIVVLLFRCFVRRPNSPPILSTMNRSTPRLVDAFGRKSSLRTLSIDSSSNETGHLPSSVAHKISTISSSPRANGPPPGWPSSKPKAPNKSRAAVCSPCLALCQSVLNCFSCKPCYRDDTYNARHNSKPGNISVIRPDFTTVGSNIKLALLGLDNAGKTSLALHLSGESIEDVVPTIGFSNYELSIDRFLNLIEQTDSTTSSMQNWRISLYDLGGGLRIRQIWHNYFALVHAVVFVIDSADLERLDEVKAALEAVLLDPLVAGKPILIYLNKQDRPQTMDDAEFEKAFRLTTLATDNGCPFRIESISIRNIYFRSIFSNVNHHGSQHTHHEGDGHCLDPEIGTSFRWLLERIVERWPALNARVMKDTEEQIKREKRLMSERLQRVQARQKIGARQTDGQDEPSKGDIIAREPKSANLLVPPLSPISERSSTLTNEDASNTNNSPQNIALQPELEWTCDANDDPQLVQECHPDAENERVQDLVEDQEQEESYICGEKLNKIIRKSDSLWEERGQSQYTLNTRAFSMIEKELIPPPSASSIGRTARNNKIHPSP